MPKKGPELSRIEWGLMNILWSKGKSTARQVYEETLKEKMRGYQTVKTMLDRLVAKGFLNRERLGPLWLYEPAAKRAKVRTQAIERFVDTVLEHTLAPMFAYFAKNESLSPEDIRMLKALIEEKAQKSKE